MDKQDRNYIWWIGTVFCAGGTGAYFESAAIGCITLGASLLLLAIGTTIERGAGT